MEEYFSTTLNRLKTKNYANLTLVLGNESCDLDSSVSSLVYAVFLNWQHQQIKYKVCTASKRVEEYKDDIFVSVLDVPKEDYQLKTEVAYCFKEHGITEKDLIFSNDANIVELLTRDSSNVSVTLVDHHVLSKKYKHLAPRVTELIDHRPMDRSQWRYSDEVRSTVEVVGSCCTLVAQRAKDLGTLFARDVDFFNVYPVCTDMLYSVILLDTVNFSKQVNKATPHDEDIVLFLEYVLKPNSYEETRKAKVDGLLAARSDVSGLTASQLLRKDVKIIGDIYVPSFPILVKEYLQKPEALQAVSEALSSQNCTLALLLGMQIQGGLKRDGVIISAKEDRVKSLAEFLQTWSSPPLELIFETEVHNHYFRQMNLSASRKQYVPALNEFKMNHK